MGGQQETIENHGFHICRNVCPSVEISYPITLSSEALLRDNGLTDFQSTL